MTSQVTGIEFLSKTRNVYANELSFAGRGLKLNKREDVKELVDEILKMKQMQVLRLEGNTISPEAAEELARALEKHPELERFIGNDIFTGRLKDEIPLALKSICGAIDKSGAHLVEINMCDNAFGPIGLEGLVNFLQSPCCYSLKEIRMHNNGLGQDGAKKFAAALEKCYLNSGKKFALRVFVCGRNRLEFEGSRALSAVLKQIGTLEEIQMPQNGIRPNGIEFIADACAHNKNLRVINLNDNTFRKPGGDSMARALSELENLEYINFGDCLLRSKGALQIARSLTKSTNIKEVILSFNEINLAAGLEIAELMAKKRDKLKLLDLNGNKFGEDGKMEVKNILSSLGSSLATLSEDEGSDEEEDEEDEDENDDDDDEDEEEEEEEEEGEEEEYSGEIVDVEEYEDHDEEYENYDGGDDVEHQQQPTVPTSTLFGQGFNTCKPVSFGQLSINKVANPFSNPFANIVKNKNLFLSSNEPFNKFLVQPSIQNLKQIDESIINAVCKDEKFNGDFLIRILDTMSQLYKDESNPDTQIVLNISNSLSKNFLDKSENADSFVDALLVYSGLLKSEDKSYQPSLISEDLLKLFKALFKQAYFPQVVKDKLNEFIKFKSQFSSQSMSPLAKSNNKSLQAILSLP